MLSDSTEYHGHVQVLFLLEKSPSRGVRSSTYVKAVWCCVQFQKGLPFGNGWVWTTPWAVLLRMVVFYTSNMKHHWLIAILHPFVLNLEHFPTQMCDVFAKNQYYVINHCVVHYNQKEYFYFMLLLLWFKLCFGLVSAEVYCIFNCPCWIIYRLEPDSER